MACRLTLLPKTPSTRSEDAGSALDSIFGAAVVRRRREVASVIARVLVVSKARPQAGRNTLRLEVLGISAAWRVLGLGIEPLLRQSFDHPQRIARPLVEIHDVVFVVARPMTDRSAVLECRVAWRRRRAAADPSGCGTRRNMPGAPHEGSQQSAGCTALLFTSSGLLSLLKLRGTCSAG